MENTLAEILKGNITQEQLSTLKEKSNIKFPLYGRQSILLSSIDEMNLSARSHNCLKRAGLHTVGDIIKNINSWSDLLNIRNMGVKSAKEVVREIFIFQYSSLNPNEQKKFIEKTVAMNI